MSRITITGTGVVSPAGWGVPALREFLAAGKPVEPEFLERTTAGGEVVRTPIAKVPALTDRSLLPKSPRLRRASSVGKFSAAAVLEALGQEKFDSVVRGELRLGVICSMMNGCVNYSNRFYGEVLADPKVASPILFPETVYNAPASHISAVTNSTAPNDTIIGDGAEFFIALDLAAEWLGRGDCDAVVIVAPEEADWLSAEALGYYDSRMLAAEGAAAVLLERDGDGPQLLAVPDGVSYALEPDRGKAFARLWSELDVDADALWVDGRNGVPRLDAAEESVHWSGPRVSTRKLLGEAMGASAAIQFVAAVDALEQGAADQAVVTSVGGNQGVGGCVLQRR
ncbi:beta-ketoacyl synthase N-terminal-like domain-containing protein [Haloferula sargassicola]|uniref:Beta-ketoacyl synthase-like N-terminal domain-containing protein n=1 Tax=Haloferula sargassicola TaxID=490096 RepID=A0ABP9UP85_9BACT